MRGRRRQFRSPRKQRSSLSKPPVFRAAIRRWTRRPDLDRETTIERVFVRKCLLLFWLSRYEEGPPPPPTAYAAFFHSAAHSSLKRKEGKIVKRKKGSFLRAPCNSHLVLIRKRGGKTFIRYVNVPKSCTKSRIIKTHHQFDSAPE